MDDKALQVFASVFGCEPEDAKEAASVMRCVAEAPDERTAAQYLSWWECFYLSPEQFWTVMRLARELGEQE